MKDSRVLHFDTVVVWLEGFPYPVTYAKLPDTMVSYDEMLSGHSEDRFIFWYCDTESWDTVINAKQGDELPGEVVFDRFD